MTAAPAPEVPFYGNYMPDCIHLHACRRLQAIAKTMGMKVPRFCTEECECYQPYPFDVDTDYISVGEALDYARAGASSIRNGYDEYDVYCSIDLGGTKLSVILEDCKYEL